MLLDSNILIYGIHPDRHDLRVWLDGFPELSSSSLSRVEVLGYYKLSDDDRIASLKLISQVDQLPVTEAIIDEAIRLRQIRKMDLGDAIIAATALVHAETLATANTTDFYWIPGFTLVNPLDQLKPTP